MSIDIYDPNGGAKICMIWMHGLGADSSDMKGLVQSLENTPPIRHVFLNAPYRPVTLNNGMTMRAWYNILGLTLQDREDREGILESESFIRKIIEQQVMEGFNLENIFLAGFSQGSAMALFTGLRTPGQLGGIIALSGYLPLSKELKPVLNTKTPIFMGSGEYDMIVQPTWTMLSAQFLSQFGFKQVDWRRYPMDHSVCMEEIIDLSRWISSVIVKEGIL